MKLKKMTAALTAAGVVLSGPLAPVASAANHPLSDVRHDKTTGVSTLDTTFGIDWDIDNPPAGRDKAYVNAVINEFAKSLFTLTEGRQRLGTVRVYTKSRYMDNVDSQLFNKPGRANASISGWGQRGLTSTQFVSVKFPTGEIQEESIVNIGKVTAHEWVHYGLGLLDEYKEDRTGTPTAGLAPFPQKDDTPRDTIMNDHTQFAGLSTPSDYTSAANRATAHYRLFGKSAWETLVSDPATDPQAAKEFGAPRVYWEAFKGIPAPTSATLKAPVAGYDAALSVVYMPDNTMRQVIVIDRRLSPDLFAAAKRAAEQFVRKADATSRLAVIAYPAQLTPPVVNFTVIDDNSKTTMISAINALTAAPADDTRIDDGLSTSLSMLQTGRQSIDTPGILLVTTNAVEVSQTTVTTLKTANVPVQTLTVDTPAAALKQYARGADLGVNLRKAAAGNVLMRTLAEATGGVYRHAHNASELVSSANKSAASTQGRQEAVIASGEVASLAAAQTRDIAFSIGAGDLDGKVLLTVTTAAADFTKLGWSLVSPTGTVISGSLPAGISVTDHADEGTREITIASNYAGRSGGWKLRLQASSAISSPIEYYASTDTLLEAEPMSYGGTAEDSRPLVLQLIVKGPQQVAGARVVADLYDDKGKLLYANVPARDDGVAPDVQGNDGIYTLAIGDSLPQGEYEAVFRVDNADGTAVLTTGGAHVKGVDAAPVSLGTFSRTTELYFVKELTTTPAVTSKKVMTEYRFAPLDYYFVTSRDTDKAVLDAAAGWSRTGLSFNTLSTGALGTGGIARYYFDQVAKAKSRGSHFYTVLDGEKKLLASSNPTNAQGPGKAYNEGIDSYVFFPLTEGVGGSCVSGQVPVYRAFRGNAKFPDDANHRYTTDLTVYNGLVAAGWDGEGVKFCSPQ